MTAPEAVSQAQTVETEAPKPEELKHEEPAAQVVGKLPPSLEAVIRQTEERDRKAQIFVVAQIGNLNWGKNLDEVTRRSIAEYGRQFDVDPTTEIDILGNRIYLNNKYYFRQLSLMVHEGLVEYAYEEFVHIDSRLDVRANEAEPVGANAAEIELWSGSRLDARKEIKRREDQRIEFGIPDEAEGSCIFHLKLRSVDREFTGVNWCGGGTGDHKAQGKGDPVGDMEPVKTAATRAARRCLMKASARIPSYAKKIQAVEAAAEKLNGLVEHDNVRVEEQQKTDAAIGAKPVNTQGYE